MGPPPGLFAELGRWRDKAIKRGKAADFDSDIIPAWLHDELMEAQKVYGPESTFSFLKQVPLSVRMKAEKEIKRKIEAILSKYQGRAARAIRNNEQFDYDGMADELRAAVMPEISNLVLDNALRLSVDTGIAFDPSIINTEALRWAREYSYELVTGLTNTTRNQLQEAFTAFTQTPGLTIGDITNLIAPSFGPVRADMIAATEVTRAYSMATNRTQALLQAETPELTTTRVLNTMVDEFVCPVCGPLEGAPEDVWRGEFPNGPPLHPRCRCSLSIRFDAPEQLEKEFGQRQRERDKWLKEQGLA